MRISGQRRSRAMRLLFGIGLALLVTMLAGPAFSEEPQTYDCKTRVFFSPNGGCTDAIVSEIGKAKREILVQAYSFTSVPIAKALVEAHKRGVICKVILDKSQRKEKYSSADFLVNSGIETWIDEKPKIAHSKVMVIDGETIITGSFNFTKSAEDSNVENLLILSSPELAKRYQVNWLDRKSVSLEYKAVRPSF